MYPGTPSTASFVEAGLSNPTGGGSQSAPLQGQGVGSDATSPSMRAYYLARMLQQGVSMPSGGVSDGFGVQLDAAERKVARRMVRALLVCLISREQFDSCC